MDLEKLETGLFELFGMSGAGREGFKNVDRLAELKHGFLGALGAVMGWKAKKRIASDPALKGAGEATAALAIGSFVTLMWVLMILLAVIAS